MRVLALTLALSPFVAVAVWQNSFDGHIQKLQEAQSLSLTLTVSEIGGMTQDIRVIMSKPNRIRIDDPKRLTTTDGKTVWIYDKVAKTYEEVPAADAKLAHEWTHDGVWIYNAFFNLKFADEVASATKGSARKLRNVSVVDWTVTRKDKQVFQVQLAEENGIARGFQFKRDKTDVFVFAKEFQVSNTPIAEGDFAFVAPAGVTKKEAGAVAGGAALTFADIKPILDANCVGCHSGGGAKKGVILSSYQEVVKHVTPGDPDGSRMIRPVKRGMMPPGRPLPAETVAKLEAWVKAGAKP